ncbi:GNAT family N-acetyltransferase [Pelistega suis]|uniref:GNAT family N-acetyltransferase n=1 Tax=Pelistega suis TaxID=1631957 RepID=A0A849P4U2_9BURK|nr:GNAT family N-acetyltransferase [Pelistega suis]NOL51033.1 GNAT family N-acetyltransferase [Pelistega suis]
MQGDVQQSLTIRPAQEGDVAAICALQKQCYSEAFHENEIAFLSKINGAKGLCWVAENQGQLLAYLMSVPVKTPYIPCLNMENYQQPDGADMLYLHDMAIVPHARGLGLKRRLLDKVLAHAQQAHFRQAILIAVQNSVPIWEKEGFSIVDASVLELAEVLQSYGSDAKLMSKTLFSI